MSSVAIAVVIALALTLAGPRPASAACSTDADCRAGERCLRSQGLLTGLCGVGGIPSPTQPDGPTEIIVVPGRTYGNPCRSGTDCGVNAV